MNKSLRWEIKAGTMNLVSKFAGYSELGLYRLWKGLMELTTAAKFRPNAI